jgi:hypothetical protein
MCTGKHVLLGRGEGARAFIKKYESNALSAVLFGRTARL